ncbi:MAG: hypothetical protein P3B76_06640 [Gemmatimonadota bacterium]|nr:hypothetical protein [Gemmatimonadota bacterium]
MQGRLRRAGLAMSLLAIGACRESMSDAAVAPVPAAPPSAQLEIRSAAAGDTLITVELHVRGLHSADAAGAVPALPISVTASVQYDTTRLRFLADDSPGDGALRAVHAAAGRVMVAAAHATGFSGERFATLRFASRDNEAYRTLLLQLTELHLTDATDVRDRVAVRPPVVVR